MAILIMLTVVVVILPPSKSLDALPRPFRSQDLALLRDEYREQSNIKQSLLERLNKFSRENSQKLVILRPNNRYQDFSPIANEKHQRGLIFGDQYYISNIEPNYRTTSITSEVSNPTAMNPKISQKSGEDEWKQIRQRRLRYYKAYRKIRNLHHRRQKDSEDDSAINRDRINYRRKETRESTIDPTNIAFNDWETFITDYSKVIPQYNQRRSTLKEYDEIEGMNNNMNSMNNQFLKINESSISSPSGYIPQIREMQSFGVARNPLDYQQLATNLNSEIMSKEAEAAERLPPPPNPKSTEASVHTVKVYPPSQQPSSTDYQGTSIFQNNNPSSGNYQKYDGKAGFEQQSIPQLISNDYNVDATYTPEANPDCINDPCETDNTNPFDSTADERCNSPRLKQIILQNIVERNAEASKQAIYNVCEVEMEVPCNVICGTGFYSYIARATQFCLISAMDVTCYAFLPVCDFDSNLIGKQWTKRHRVKV